MKNVLDALEVRFDSDAGENKSIRNYLFTLLDTLWKEGEGFSGKRPFGNSGREYDLYRPLIQHGFIAGSLDSDGDVLSCDRSEANAFVSKLIHAAIYGVGIAE